MTSLHVVCGSPPPPSIKIPGYAYARSHKNNLHSFQYAYVNNVNNPIISFYTAFELKTLYSTKFCIMYAASTKQKCETFVKVL